MRWTLSRTRELGARKRPSVRTPPLAHLPLRGEPRRLLRLRPGASHLYRSRASASLSHTHTRKNTRFLAHASCFISMYSMIIRRYSTTRALTRRPRLSASRAATSCARESLVRWFTTRPRFDAREERARPHTAAFARIQDARPRTRAPNSILRAARAPISTKARRRRRRRRERCLNESNNLR